MFEPRLTALRRTVRDLAWAVSPRRSRMISVGERILRAAAWLALGAILAAGAIAWYAHAYPGSVTAADARLEDQGARYLVYSIGLSHRGVEVRCLLVIYRDREKFTVSC